MSTKVALTTRSEFVDLRDGLITYLQAFIEYNNSRCMFKIQRVHTDSNEVIAKHPAISLDDPDIMFGDTIGFGEDIEGADVMVHYPLQIHVGNLDATKNMKDQLQFFDNFIFYLFSNPNITGSWVWNSYLHIVPDYVFDKQKTEGLLIIIGMKGMYHI